MFSACLIRFCSVNLLDNLHPNCTCSCPLALLTEGRSARDLTQAAPSKKKAIDPPKPARGFIRQNRRGPCSGRWFLVRFSDLILGSQDNGFIQERGVVAGTRVGVVILVPVFLGALVAVFLVVLVFFGRYLGCNSVPGQGLDSCVVVWLSFFVAVLVGPFVAVLVVVFLFAFV